MGGMMKKAHRRQRGFTLVELMIVVSIMGLVAILSLPGYNRFMQSWNLNGDVQQLAASMRTARAAAVMKNIDVVFRFDMATNTYWYFEDVNRNGNRDAGEYLSAVYELTSGNRFAAHTLSSTRVTFGNKGNTRESGSITLRNVRNKARAVRIYGGTGNVAVD